MSFNNTLQTLTTKFKNENFEVDNNKLVEYLQALETMVSLPELTPSELYVFLKYCFTLGLNPLFKEIYLVKFKGKNVPIIAYQEYVKRASRHPNYQLPETQVVMTDANGKPLPKDQIYVIAKVQRKGDNSVFQKVYLMSEWKKNSPIWETQPIDMLQTRAIKNILAIAYPEEVASLERYEMSGEVEVIKDSVKTIEEREKLKSLIGVKENE